MPVTCVFVFVCTCMFVQGGEELSKQTLLFKKALSETDTALQEGLFEGLEKVCIDKHM